MLLALCVLLATVECTHIFTLDKDFNMLNSDPGLAKHANEVLKRLQTFKVAVHPRIRLFYILLKNSMERYAHRTSDSLCVAGGNARLTGVDTAVPNGSSIIIYFIMRLLLSGGTIKWESKDSGVTSGSDHDIGCPLL